MIEAAVERGELQFPPPPREGTKDMGRRGKAKPEAEEQTSVEVKKPDFERALKVIANDIKPNEEENASIRGDLSAAWKIVEDECHCNKAAAKAYAKLAAMSEEKRDDYLRTMYGLMQAGGIGISRDLVDQMTEEEAPDMPVAPAVTPERPAHLASLN